MNTITIKDNSQLEESVSLFKIYSNTENFPLNVVSYVAIPSEDFKIVYYNLEQNSEGLLLTLNKPSDPTIIPLDIPMNSGLSFIIFNNKPFIESEDWKNFLNICITKFKEKDSINRSYTSLYNRVIYCDGVELRVKLLADRGIIAIMARDKEQFRESTLESVKLIINLIEELFLNE